jgi:hypothetical protein
MCLIFIHNPPQIAHEQINSEELRFLQHLVLGIQRFQLCILAVQMVVV